MAVKSPIVRFAAALSLAVGGCTGTQYADRADEAVEMPENYAEAEVEGEPLDRWCSDFGAPQLEELVDRAFERNLSLRQSWARLEEASAAARQAGAARWPVVNLEGSFSRQEQPSIPVEIDQNQFNTSVGVNYELDLWGRMANLHQAAKYERRAARMDVEAMAMTLTSQIAENWFNLVHQRALADLLERQLDVSERYLEITLVRLARGAATALDVNQQRQQVQSLEGQLELVRGRQKTARHQLATLVGEAPGREVAGDRRELPGLPERPAAGVPADLLERRPDLRAAMLRLEAADERTAAAVKQQFPSIQLSTSIFTQAPNIDQFFEEFFWQAMISGTQPLFDGGRRFAEIDSAEARAEAQMYQYGQTLLDALREVEDSLVLESRQTAYIESLREQIESSEQALQLARERYQRGAADYLRVLTSLQSVQSVEQSLLEARRQRLSYRVQLCRALGGTWSRELEAPDGEDDERAGESGEGESEGSEGDAGAAGSEDGDAEADRRPADTGGAEDSTVPPSEETNDGQTTSE